MPASDMSSSWSLSSLRPRKLSWIGLNLSCSSYWVSNQALRRADSALTCSAPGAAVAVGAALPSAAGLQAARPSPRATARARALRNGTGDMGNPRRGRGILSPAAATRHRAGTAGMPGRATMPVRVAPHRPGVRMSDDIRNDVSRQQAEDAVRTLLRWSGDDPTREGLLDTPKRVVKAYQDWFSGYALDPDDYMARTFEEVGGYDEMIVLRDIEYESHCEHHMAPIIGKVHVGYLPDGKVVGISKLARVVEAYARRFQVQEKMTSQIANCIQRALQPRGVGVVVEGAHECMTTRGIHKRGVSMVTSKMLGSFRDDARTRAEFLQFIAVGHGR